jgi:lipid-A-disaccharide synthase
VTLELALHKTPTVVTFAIKKWDQFLAQKILKINLPFYCIVNILLQKEVFPELFGTNLTLSKLTSEAKRLLLQKKAREACLAGCAQIKEILTNQNPSLQAAKEIISLY